MDEGLERYEAANAYLIPMPLAPDPSLPTKHPSFARKISATMDSLIALQRCHHTIFHHHAPSIIPAVYVSSPCVFLSIDPHNNIADLIALVVP